MGVSMFGEGKWASIKNAFPNELSTRTTVNIKDCYRNMKKKKDKQQMFIQLLTNHSAVCQCCGATALSVTNNEEQSFPPMKPSTHLAESPGLDATSRSERDTNHWKSFTAESTTADATLFAMMDTRIVIPLINTTSSRRAAVKTTKGPTRPSGTIANRSKSSFARKSAEKRTKGSNQRSRRNTKRYKSSYVLYSSDDSSTSTESTSSVTIARRKRNHIPKRKIWWDDSSSSDDMEDSKPPAKNLFPSR
jgi:hypothetical protein